MNIMENDDEVCFGRIEKEGGRMNYSKPLLLDNGTKVAVACGLDIRILNISDSRHVFTLSMHTAKVVGMAMDAARSDDTVLSCAENGELFLWKLTPEGLQCSPLEKYPIPKSAVVEHLAHVGSIGQVALIVMMNKGLGPRQLLLQRNREQAYTEKYNVLANDLLPGYNTFGFSSAQAFCAVLTTAHCGLACNIVPIYNDGTGHKRKKRKNRRILCGKRQPTCVAVHPSEETVAIGDDFGGIEVYYNVFFKKPSGSRRFHWHHLPVCDLLFSQSGMELYSCGHEGVLVQWHLAEGNKIEKDFLPRLGLAITHMALSADNSTMVATHSDNSFSLVNMYEMLLESVLLGQGITLPEVRDSADGSSSLPPLLAYDNRTAAVVTKAKPGYFLFYHTPSQQQLFLVDIVQENYVGGATGHRDVLHTSLDRSGCIMATVDAMIGLDTKQQQLKFWHFSQPTNTWKLDANIMSPHLGEVVGCLLQPVPPSRGQHQDTLQETNIPLCLTWSSDNEIKIWAATITKDSMKWCMMSSSTYKRGGVTATAGCWSPCGSFLALAFGSSLTLWEPQPLKWKLQLSKEQSFSPDIFAVCFSAVLRGLVVVACSSEGVQAWCTLSKRVLYTETLDAVALNADPHTGLVAVATKQGEIIVFRGEEGVPLCCLDTGASSARSLLFCPPQDASKRHRVTKLLYYTSDMELLSVPISLCGAEILLRDLVEDGDQKTASSEGKPETSKLSILMAESKSVAVTNDDNFAFRHADQQSFVRPDVIIEKFEGTNFQRPSLSRFFDTIAEEFDKAS